MIQNRCIIIHDLLWQICFASIFFDHGCVSRDVEVIICGKSLCIVSDDEFFFCHFGFYKKIKSNVVNS
nr:MAG TPA: hypothetical protein [Caudoviricetes sp.]